MKFHIHKALAVAAAVAIVIPVASAFAEPVAVPDPNIPTLPPQIPITLPSGPLSETGLVPPLNLPDSEAVLAMLQGQVQLIAAALGEQPGDLLNRVLGTEIPSASSVVITVNDLLNRLTGTKIFDVKSNGILGSTEISVGNVSHGFSISNVAKGAVDVVCLDTQTDAQCKAAANNPRALEMPAYSVHQSNWVPKVPTLIPALIPGLTPENAILGTTIVLPLVSALAAIGLASVPGIPTPVPLPLTGLTTTTGGETHLSGIPTQICTTAPAPAICQGVTSLIKSNLAVLTLGKGSLTNIRAEGLQTVGTDGVVTKKGVHGGGQMSALSSYSNVDTAYRGLPASVLNGTSLLNETHIPVWVPLLTATNALVDNGVDFLGIPVTANLNNISTRSCAGGASSLDTEVVGEETIRTAHFDATTCKASGSFVGFGIAVYGDHAPVNFETDLAPLWEPAPVAEAAIADALTAVLAALAPSVPNPLVVLTYGLGLAGIVTGIQGDLTGSLPETPALPALPVALPALPVGLP